MATSFPNQLPLSGLPQASYPLHIWCGRCGHSARMIVGIEVVHNLYQLRCNECGGRGRGLVAERLAGASMK